MSNPVPETPPLPYPAGATTTLDLASFDQDLIRALFPYLADLARRVNGALMKDGSEAMTGDLDMGGFDINNVGTVTGNTEGSHNGPVGDVTPDTGSFTTLEASGLISANGGQIEFPATQNPSADPNTLDDYEEGSWTPVVEFGGASVGVTYNLQIGRYTKIGRMVCVQCDVALTSNGTSTGAMSISGLPFTVGGITGTAAVGFFSGFTGLLSVIMIHMSSTSAFLVNASGGASTIAITDAQTTDTARVIFTGFYTI